MLERHRVVAVARQRPLGAPPDVGVVKDVPETLPSVLVVGRDGEQAEQRVARDDLTIVAAQIEADFHLPVQRLRIGRGEARGGADLGERREAADDGPSVLDSAQEHVGGGIAGSAGKRPMTGRAYWTRP